MYVFHQRSWAIRRACWKLGRLSRWGKVSKPASMLAAIWLHSANIVRLPPVQSLRHSIKNKFFGEGSHDPEENTQIRYASELACGNMPTTSSSPPRLSFLLLVVIDESFKVLAHTIGRQDGKRRLLNDGAKDVQNRHKGSSSQPNPEIEYTRMLNFCNDTTVKREKNDIEPMMYHACPAGLHKELCHAIDGVAAIATGADGRLAAVALERKIPFFGLTLTDDP